MPPRAVISPFPGATTADAGPRRGVRRGVDVVTGRGVRRGVDVVAGPGVRRADDVAVGRGVRRAVAALAGLVAAAGSAAAAEARQLDPPTGGVAPVAARDSDPLVAMAYGGGAPQVTGVACARFCSPGGAARPGSLVRIAGRRLEAVREVRFLAAPGGRDDTSVAPERAAERAVVAQVPYTASTGPVALARADGSRSLPSPKPLVVDAAVALPAEGTVEAEVQASKVFFGGQRNAELSYVVGGSVPVTISVELVRAADGEVVERWTEADVTPGVPQSVPWSGTVEGRVQRDGVYRFRVVAAPGPAAVAALSSAAPSAQSSFTFMRHRFPILGAHEYGDGGAHFGGGRGHQGEDVFADCGTPVVAARAGRVQFKQFEGRAGHYVVVDGAGTDVDYTYMHLRDAALVDVGDRVRTGELIGYVGATGRASDCHLHFEMWSGPGWYSGGAAFDPLPHLREWDAHS